MAHKKRKEEDSDDIEVPEFDEVAFMRGDIEGTKAAVVAILYAIPAALVAFGVTVALAAPVVALGVGLFFLVTLRRLLPLLRVKSAAFKFRDWLGHSSTFFFSFLAFWILLMNQPFGDFTPPDVRTVGVNGVAVRGGFATVNASNWSATVITADVGDNVGLEGVTLTVSGATPPTTAMTGDGAAHTATVDLGSQADRRACITAVDRSRHQTTVCFTIRPG